MQPQHTVQVEGQDFQQVPRPLDQATEPLGAELAEPTRYVLKGTLSGEADLQNLPMARDSGFAHHLPLGQQLEGLHIMLCEPWGDLPTCP